MPRILALLPTTSYRATALNAAARALDAELVVASDRRQALEHVTEGRTLTLDFRDIEASVRTVLEFDRLYPLDAVVGADDETTVLAATLAERLGIPANPPASVERATNKALTRVAFAAAGMPSPGFEVFDVRDDPQGIASVVRFPCVIKPTFLSASRGVMRADDPDEFVVHYHRLARILSDPEVERRGGAEARRVLVEDYLPGAEVAVEGLVSDGEVEILAIFDKPDPLVGPFFQETIYVTPSRLPRERRAAVERATGAAVRALGLVHGPIHAELRVGARDVFVLELAPRAIGGRCGKVLTWAGGCDVEQLVLRHALGRPTRFQLAAAAGVMMIPIPRAGVLESVHGTDLAAAVPGVVGIDIVIPSGESIAPPPEGNRYLGFLFARGDTPEAAEDSLRAAHALLDVRITGTQAT